MYGQYCPHLRIHFEFENFYWYCMELCNSYLKPSSLKLNTMWCIQYSIKISNSKCICINVNWILSIVSSRCDVWTIFNFLWFELNGFSCSCNSKIFIVQMKIEFIVMYGQYSGHIYVYTLNWKFFWYWISEDIQILLQLQLKPFSSLKLNTMYVWTIFNVQIKFQIFKVYLYLNEVYWILSIKPSQMKVSIFNLN